MFTNNLAGRIGWMAGHWKPYARDVAPLLVLTGLNAAVIVLFPYILKRIIDGIVESFSPGYLAVNVGLLVAIGLVDFVLYALLQLSRARLNMRFEYGVRLRAFEGLLRMAPRRLARLTTGDYVTRLTDDVNDKLSWYMCSGIFRVLEAGSLIVFGLAMMIWLSPRLALYCAAPLPVLVGLFLITSRVLYRRYEDVQQTISRLNAALDSAFSGVRVVKAFGAEGYQRQVVAEAIEAQRRAEVRAARWQIVIDSLYGQVWQLAVAAVLLAGGAMVIAGNVTLGEIVAFESYVLLLVWPMFDVGQFLVRGRLSAVSIGRLVELEEGDTESATVDAAPLARHVRSPAPDDYCAVERDATALDVRFEGVTFRYDDARPAALADVSFHAKPGRLTAVVGPVAAGKSTALALVPRIIEPDAGRVLVAGRDVRQWDSIALRQCVGYAPQDAHLLSGTLRDNIRFGRAWVADDDLDAAVHAACLLEPAQEWPEGLDTVIGGRGARLSGGQKHRVSLARALAGRPNVLLLDDCTANLDAQTEANLWERIRDSFGDCTILLVTHRPRTLQQADTIVVLDLGNVREAGTFHQLDRPRTRFHSLYTQWKLQEATGE